MDKLINKAAAHGHEIRKGKAIDMDKFLQDMDQMYIIDLDIIKEETPSQIRTMPGWRALTTIRR